MAVLPVTGLLFFGTITSLFAKIGEPPDSPCKPSRHCPSPSAHLFGSLLLAVYELDGQGRDGVVKNFQKARVTAAAAPPPLPARRPSRHMPCHALTLLPARLPRPPAAAVGHDGASQMLDHGVKLVACLPACMSGSASLAAPLLLCPLPKQSAVLLLRAVARFEYSCTA